MTRTTVLAAAFLATLGVVVGGTVVVGQLADDDSRQVPTIENEQYRSPDLLQSRSPGTANVTMDATAEPQTVVIDPGLAPAERRQGVVLGGLGPSTTTRKIMPLVNALVRNGHDVRIYTPPEDRRARQQQPRSAGPTKLGRMLAEADAFVTFRTDYDTAQLDDIGTFRSADGRILAAVEPSDAFDRPGSAGLRSVLNATSVPGYVYNIERNDLNYQRVFATPTGSATLTEGVDRVVLPTATPLRGSGAGAELTPIPGTQLSTSRVATTAPLMLRTNDTVVVGDRTFIWPSNVRRADNDALVGNLADFLVRNDRSPSTQPPNTRSANRSMSDRRPARDGR